MISSPSSLPKIQHSPGADSSTPVKTRTGTSSRRQVICDKPSPPRAPAPTVAKDAIALSARSVRIAQTGGEPPVGKPNLFINHARSLDAVGRSELLVELQQTAARNQVNPSPHFDRQLYTDAIDYIKQSMSGPHDEMQDLVKDLPATLAQEATQPGDTHTLYQNLLSVAADSIPGDRHTDAHKDKQREFVANLLSAFTLAGDLKPDDLKAFLGHLPHAERAAMARADKYTQAPVSQQLMACAVDAKNAFHAQAGELVNQSSPLTDTQGTASAIISAARNLDEFRSYALSMPDYKGKSLKDVDNDTAEKAEQLKGHLKTLLAANPNIIGTAEPDTLRELHDALKMLDIDLDKDIHAVLDQRISRQRADCEKAVTDAVTLASTGDTKALLVALDGANIAARNLDAAQRHRDGLPQDAGDGGAKLLDTLISKAVSGLPKEQAEPLRKALQSPALRELERMLDAAGGTTNPAHQAVAARMGASAGLLAALRQHAGASVPARGPLDVRTTGSLRQAIEDAFQVGLDVATPLAKCQESISNACEALAHDRPDQMLAAMDDFFASENQLRQAQELTGDKTGTGAAQQDFFMDLIQQGAASLPADQKEALTAQLQGKATQALENVLRTAGTRLEGSSNSEDRQRGLRMSASADLLQLMRVNIGKQPGEPVATDSDLSNHAKAALQATFKVNADGSDWSEPSAAGAVAGQSVDATQHGSQTNNSASSPGASVAQRAEGGNPAPDVVDAAFVASFPSAADARSTLNAGQQAALAASQPMHVGGASAASAASVVSSGPTQTPDELITAHLQQMGSVAVNLPDATTGLSTALTNGLRSASEESGSVSYTFKDRTGEKIGPKTISASKMAAAFKRVNGPDARAEYLFKESVSTFKEVAGNLAGAASMYAHPSLLDGLKNAMTTANSPIRLRGVTPGQLLGGTEHTQFEVSANGQDGVTIHCDYNITGATSFRPADGTTGISFHADMPASAKLSFTVTIDSNGVATLSTQVEATQNITLPTTI